MTVTDQQRAELRRLLAEGTQGPWEWNSYSAIHSADNGHDAWCGERLDEGHTLERYGSCVACGEWTWESSDGTGYQGKGCRLFTEDYNRDPYVAGVPAHHGDTATGRHAADAALIAAAITALPALLDALDAAQQRASRMRVDHGTELSGWQHRAESAESERDSLAVQLDEALGKVARVERAVGMQGFRFSSHEDHAAALAIVRAALAGPSPTDEGGKS